MQDIKEMDGPVYDDVELRSVAFFAYNYNCCEMFYKMKKGIECKENEVELNQKAGRFYESLKTLIQLSREEIQKYVDNGVNVGTTYITKTQEYSDYEKSRMMIRVRDSKVMRFFRKLLPFNKDKERKYDELNQKYGFLQKDYEDKSEKMKQYKVDNLDSKIEKDAISQVKDGVRENRKIEDKQRQEGIER